MSYVEDYYQSEDGLNLCFRSYGHSSQRLPIICLSGLTRNSQDFDEFAETFSRDRQIFTLDYRGRGKSDYDPNYQNYNPQTYLQDIFRFLESQKIEKAVFLGTSLGGLLSIAIGGLAPKYVGGIILNDVGPEVASAGGSRIAGYVGKDVRFQSLEEIAAAQKEQYTSAYPDVEDSYWLETAKVSFTYDDKDKNFRPNYDLGLGKALVEQIEEGNSIDLWPVFENLKNIPMLAIRGALSDVLSEETFQKMQDILPEMQHITLPNRGHVPLLNEPQSLQALTRFLDKT
ncbi:alpha/beta fold hydrolase [Sneathiella limimaris]|uniref:alpha/beta fold hydrolase n=1 Tax=Sneathiella limimaris TaxID=1964213 RepID=UPI00146B6425|nr:alpha/beta hydrolase [Sneathiella limimaris]